jgi:carbon storage regulator
MLVLTRKTNEKIKIGNDITVTVVQANNGSVKLGIEAPDGVNISRAELVKRDGEGLSEWQDELP